MLIINPSLIETNLLDKHSCLQLATLMQNSSHKSVVLESSVKASRCWQKIQEPLTFH